jgi:hypothetical protein
MTFDEALALSQQQDTESPAEREEREVIEAGRALDLETDREAVEAADQVAIDWAEEAEKDKTEASYRTHWYY